MCFRMFFAMRFGEELHLGGASRSDQFESRDTSRRVLTACCVNRPPATNRVLFNFEITHAGVGRFAAVLPGRPGDQSHCDKSHWLH